MQSNSLKYTFKLNAYYLQRSLIFWEQLDSEI